MPKQKKTIVPYVIQRCSDCGAEVHEDRSTGDLVCRECGLCERLLVSDDVDYADVDWTRISLATKSQHVPVKYFTDLVRKFEVSEVLVPELVRRFKAVKFHSERNKPDGRKSLPSYRKRRLLCTSLFSIPDLCLRLVVCCSVHITSTASATRPP